MLVRWGRPTSMFELFTFKIMTNTILVTSFVIILLYIFFRIMQMKKILLICYVKFCPRMQHLKRKLLLDVSGVAKLKKVWWALQNM